MLSKRLLEISKLINEDKVVFDVGSDHALLPCFLVKEGIISKAYACDNKEGPLNKAIQNIKRYNLEGKVIPILSNGIDDITDDVKIITICGMGFYTVKNILENKDLSKYDKIIVQINKDSDLLRKYINDNNFTIEDEIVIYDDFYHEVEVFSAKSHNRYGGLEIKYGPILLQKRDRVFIDYLHYKKKVLKNIYKKSNDPTILDTINEIEEILNNGGKTYVESI